MPAAPALKYGLYRLGGAVAQTLSDAAAERLAQSLSDLVFRLDSRERAHIRANMRHVLGPEAAQERIEQVVRGVYRNMLRNYLDLFRTPRLTPEALRARVEIHGMEVVADALAAGRGGVGASAHLGNADTVGQVMAAMGHPMLVPAEHVQPEALFRYMCRLRGHFGNRFIPVDGPLTPLVRELKRGGLVALALDRDPTGSGIVVNFFGAPARMPDGAVRLAMRTGAALVVAFSQRIEARPGHYCLNVAQIELPTDSHSADAVRLGVEMALSHLEQAILQTPDQWVMTVPVWNLPDATR